MKIDNLYMIIIKRHLLLFCLYIGYILVLYNYYDCVHVCIISIPQKYFFINFLNFFIKQNQNFVIF